MPPKPRRPCSHMGCPTLTTERYCESHKQIYQKKYNQDRGSATKRGYDAEWRRARAAFLMKNPLCQHCFELKWITAASVVDHITPHKGNFELFWNRNNWQPLCKSHHDSKTAREDGGFGR